MSLDQIIKINIQTQSLSMAQKGFGVPLILGEFEHPDDWLVKTVSDASDLLEWEKRLTPLPPKSASEDKIKEAAQKEKEAISEKQNDLRKGAVYKATEAIFSQNPRLPKIKIGRIKEGKNLVASLGDILLEDDGFYGVLPAQLPTLEELKDVRAILESRRLILGLDVCETGKDIAANLKSDRVFAIYSPHGEHIAAAWMGKMLPESPGSSSWAYQSLKNIEPYILEPNEAEKLETANINRYIGIKGVGVTLDGKATSGKFIDITRGIDWLHVRMQERLFRLLMLNKKIPYTLKGIDLVRSEIMAQLKEGVYRGLLAENPEPKVSTPTIEEVDQSDRDARILPKVRFSGRLAGAIHKIEIQGTVTV